MVTSRADLASITVVNTRPEEQAKALTASLEKLGATVFENPVIEISDLTDTLNSNSVQKNLAQCDILIFVSANAVKYFFRLIATQNIDLNKGSRLPLWATVGKSTANVLAQQSLALLGKTISADIFPQRGSDSESLLKHPEFSDCSGKKILIVRGLGGREFLAEQLRIRGADVDYLEVYQRRCPQCETAEKSRKLLQRWQSQKIDFIIITSSEGLVNLLTILGGALYTEANIEQLDHSQALYLLASSKILVVHEKIAAKARKLGFMQDIIVAEKANNEAIIEALLNNCE